MKNLELRIFRFDKNKDYESYYKPYVYKLDGSFSTLYELFFKIQEDDIYFDFEKNENTYVILNSKTLKQSTKIEEIIKEFGLELIIEPLSTKRAIKDFIIDKSDFFRQFSSVQKLVGIEDKILYESLAHLYYNSEILAYHQEYLGDSMIYFIAKMIEKYPNKKKDFLKILADTHKGIFYHLKSPNEELESIVEQLKDEILKLALFDKALLANEIPKNSAFNEEIKELNEVKYDFKDFNIATYGFKACEKLKSKLKAKFISYEKENKNNAYTLLNLNPKLSYKIAADILLDAYDSGADFMVVKDERDFFMFDTCAKKLMSESGRDFKDFYILSVFEFLSLIQGVKNPSLQEHQLKVSLI